MLNVSIATIGIVLCALGILQILAGTKVDRRTERYFLMCYFSLLIFSGATLAGQLMRGAPGIFTRAGLYLSVFVEYFSPCLLAFLVSRYLLSIVDAERERRLPRKALDLFLALHFALLLVSQFTGLCYTIGADGLYRRGAWYPLSYLPPAAILAENVYLLLRERERLTRSEKLAFWNYLAVPAMAMIVQMFLYGVNYILLSTIIAALAMYLFIVNDQTERYIRQERENAKLSVNILLSQIQPHFLYNTLAVIREICYAEPEKAGDAIGEFADFLRHSMDSIQTERAIPFATELEHVRHYVSLQKLRFGDKLNVAYDIAVTDFDLPTLTIQPLVENAIRYGVRRNRNGSGTVTVRTRAYPDRVEVSVIDDGPGFEQPETADGSRSHVGLRNVRERMRYVCGGELRVDREAGTGTRVTIVLPRREEG